MCARCLYNESVFSVFARPLLYPILHTTKRGSPTTSLLGLHTGDVKKSSSKSSLDSARNEFSPRILFLGAHQIQGCWEQWVWARAILRPGLAAASGSLLPWHW